MHGFLSQSKANTQLLIFSTSEMEKALFVGSSGHSLIFVDYVMYFFLVTYVQMLKHFNYESFN